MRESRRKRWTWMRAGILLAAVLALVSGPWSAGHAFAAAGTPGTAVLTVKPQNTETPGEPVRGAVYGYLRIGELTDWQNQVLTCTLDHAQAAECLGLSAGTPCTAGELWNSVLAADMAALSCLKDDGALRRLGATGTSGSTSVSLSPGVYAVLCMEAPEGFSESKPFILMLPALSGWEDGEPVWETSVSAEPKLEGSSEDEEDSRGAVALTKTFQGKPASDKSIYASVTFGLTDGDGNEVRGIRTSEGRYTAVSGGAGEAVFRVGPDGLLIIKELAMGDYEFTELTTHESYRLLADPVRVQVVDATNAFTVDNKKKSFVPFTGGRGTGLVTFGGLFLICAGILWLLAGRMQRKKRQRGRRRRDDERKKR